MSAGRSALGVTAAGLLVAAAGCGRGDPDAPPEIHFGQDVCAACSMIVSEERFSAAAVPEETGADPLAFDDIGCLFAWESRHPGAPLRARWVHDHESGEWLRAEAAWYVRSRDLLTPMGSGVVAAFDEDSARRIVNERGGQAMAWEALREAAAGSALVRPPEPAGAGAAGPGRAEG